MDFIGFGVVDFILFCLMSINQT